MPVNTLPAATAARMLDSFDTVIDARTPAEFELDHVPGAENWPSLDNEQRIVIGTMYKQVNAFEAKKRGAAMVFHNIAAHVDRAVIDKPKGWRPLVYCWRGGNRSGAMAWALGAIGFQVTLIEGGYKAWRAELVLDMVRRVSPLSFRVVCGPTGCGKTRLLHALAAQGAQVLDLEALARHRGSVLGHLPGKPQPTQKHFDTLIWSALRDFDPAYPVFVESESKKVGNLRVPDALMDAMRASPCIDLQLPDDERVALLLEDYDYLVTDPVYFCDRLHALTELRGKSVVAGWVDLVNQGRIADVFRDLLLTHYDPGYAASIQRNFTQYGQATACALPDRHPATLEALARELAAGINTD
ncbi:MAG: tRNA 2-selenouridine(34) synthase MnmH [Burkholderiales bacterium]|nr:tRNA 2-selenouridine(34) synthase MnmH [Burkholderiales bacterium]